MAVTRDLERTIPTRKVMFWAAGRWRAGPSVSGKPWWEDHDKLVMLGQHREQLLFSCVQITVSLLVPGHQPVEDTYHSQGPSHFN